MKTPVTLFIILLSTVCSAQEKFLDKLQKVQPGQATVTVHQSTAITNRVNGVVAAPRTLRDSLAVPTVPSIPDTVPQTELTTGQKIKVNGFRIQVFSGGNSRQAKNDATRMATLFHSYFEDVPVYIHFQSPHWVCRVGDFKTREEAFQLLSQMRELGRFDEAVIVKSKVNAYY